MTDTHTLEWSGKQEDLVEAVWDNDVRIVVASGPVRAGKSWPLTQAFCDWLNDTWEYTDFGICAASAQRVEAMLLEIEECAKALGLRFRRRKAHVELGTHRGYYWVSKDRLSYRQVRGHTFSCVLADESKDLQRTCIREINNRVSLTPGLIAFSTNPGGPMERFKGEVIDEIEKGRRAGRVLYFGIDDNPGLTQEYKDELKAGLPAGPIRDRDYYGKWTQAGGLVFSQYASAVQRPPLPSTEKPRWCYIGCDAATVGVAAGLLIGVYSRGRSWVLAEWRHDGRTEGVWSQPKQAHDLAEKLCGLAPSQVIGVVSDPADPKFAEYVAAQVKAQGHPGTLADYSKPQWLPSRRMVAGALADKAVLIAPHLEHLIGEMSQLAYDEQALEETGEEKQSDGEDHLCDALVYVVDCFDLAGAPLD